MTVAITDTAKQPDTIKDYAIYTLPLARGASDQSAQGEGCNHTLLGGVYNPTQCNITADPGCAAGALSARHEQNLTDMKLTFQDDHFTLFGVNSIMGRCVTMIKNGVSGNHESRLW